MVAQTPLPSGGPDRSDISTAIRAGKARMGDLESATRARMSARYLSTMQAIEQEIAGIIARTGTGVTPRIEFLDVLFALVDEEYRRTTQLVAMDLEIGQRQAARIAFDTVQGMNLGVGPALNIEAYEQIIAATDPGSPLYRVLSGYGDVAKDAIERNLIDGMIQGHGIDQIIGAIRSEIGDGVPDWKLATIARTESMRAFRGSLSVSYQAMGVQQVRWLATLSARTCNACLARHGQLFPADYEMDSHANCRCILSPVTGLPTDIMTGDAWLRQQSETVQRRKLGSAYDDFAAGRISLNDFIGTRQSQIWGQSIFELSPRQALARHAAPPVHRFGIPADRDVYTQSDLLAKMRSEGDVIARDKNALKAWGDYQTGAYSHMNTTLRGGGRNPGDPARMKMYRKFSLDQDARLYRGMATRNNRFADRGVGAVVDDGGYVSTTVNRDIAWNFTHTADSEKDRIMVEIYAPKGTSYVGTEIPRQERGVFGGIETIYGIGEQEVVLPPGTRFMMTGNNRQDNGILVYEVIPLPPGTDPKAFGIDDPHFLDDLTEEWQAWQKTAK